MDLTGMLPARIAFALPCMAKKEEPDVLAAAQAFAWACKGEQPSGILYTWFMAVHTSTRTAMYSHVRLLCTYLQVNWSFFAWQYILVHTGMYWYRKIDKSTYQYV